MDAGGDLPRRIHRASCRVGKGQAATFRRWVPSEKLVRGGFYDRTLEEMERKPFVIGVCYASARLPTIYPRWHDIPMDRLVLA